MILVNDIMYWFIVLHFCYWIDIITFFLELAKSSYFCVSLFERSTRKL